MRNIGLDLSKRKFTHVSINKEDGEVISREYSMTGDSLNEFIYDLKPDDVVAFEAGTSMYYFYDLLKPHVQSIKVVNTYAFKVIKNSIKKNDKNDAYLLAKFLGYGELPEVYVPEKIYRELRDLANYRQKLIGMRTKLRNIISSTLQKEGIIIGRKELDNRKNRESIEQNSQLSIIGKMKIRMNVEEIKTIEKYIAEVEAKMKEIANENTEVRKSMARIMQIPCIGELSAITILAEIGGNIKRFNTKKEISAYAGMITRTCQSGETMRNRSVNRGRPMLKRTLMQVVLGQVGRYKNPIVDYYQFKKKEKCVGKAVMAASRKLITVIYIMLKYDCDYRHVEKMLYFKKMKSLGFNFAA